MIKLRKLINEEKMIYYKEVENWDEYDRGYIPAHFIVADSEEDAIKKLKGKGDYTWVLPVDKPGDPFRASRTPEALFQQLKQQLKSEERKLKEAQHRINVIKQAQKDLKKAQQDLKR